MRNLSLDEKISIKGRLATKGVPSAFLVKLETKEALGLWWHCFGTPLSQHSTRKMWRVRTNRTFH